MFYKDMGGLGGKEDKQHNQRREVGRREEGEEERPFVANKTIEMPYPLISLVFILKFKIVVVVFAQMRCFVGEGVSRWCSLRIAR